MERSKVATKAFGSTGSQNSNDGLSDAAISSYSDSTLKTGIDDIPPTDIYSGSSLSP